MKKLRYYHIILIITAICIFVPIAIILIWSFAERWPWPDMLPESYSLRTVNELFNGALPISDLLFSSIFLAAAVAVLTTVIGIMTARALEFYEFKGKMLIRLGTLLPLVVPGTVLAMGLQIVFLKMGLSDTIAGVILIHVIISLPYCTMIMTDVTRAIGVKYEEQAAVLGAKPFRSFCEVSLPMLLPGILSSAGMGFILSYSQYFTTLIIGGGRVNTLALVLIPYIQSGDRPLMSIYSAVFVFSALTIFFTLEWVMRRSIRRTLND